ncbi:MAG: hypothetical protein M5U15_02205 [Kiritimatiellae bacterium]|nr:hypothetical protein [Kiritimatiellia bacterium]
MNVKAVSKKLERKLGELFEELRSGISAREDSRAFGAMIEEKITNNWQNICKTPDIPRSHGPASVQFLTLHFSEKTILLV